MAGSQSMAFGSALSMTHYVIRVGEFLNKTKILLYSMTATEYTINIIIDTDRPREDIFRLMEESRLFGPAQYDPPGTVRTSAWFGEVS